MKLLFDENLSHRLAQSLADVFPGSIHVRDAGLRGAEDQHIWENARREGFAIVSKDTDFRERSYVEGFPPKLFGWTAVMPEPKTSNRCCDAITKRSFISRNPKNPRC